MSASVSLETESRLRPIVGLLGPIVVFRGDPVGVPARLDRLVLAHLALAEGRAIPVDVLIDAVWGERPPRQARNALQVKVSRLRTQLAEHGQALVQAQGTYRLELPREQVDASAFNLLVREAAVLVQAGKHREARAALDRAMSMWRGSPLNEVDDHPLFVAARAQLSESWLTAQELIAETDLAVGSGTSDALARLRAALDKDPLRPKARLLLMRVLEGAGRRAEALAVYDAGRRLLSDQAGLAPAPELQEAFESMLAAERSASRQLTTYEVTQAAPPGAIDTARWLAGEGDSGAAAQLAIRGSWWWWFGGQRSAGRDLLEELVGAGASTELDPRQALRASAWLAVFETVGADAESALQRGERALTQAAAFGWTSQEALAGLLLAERLYQRGQHGRAESLVKAGKTQFATEANDWGLALASVVEAKGLLLRGQVRTAAAQAHTMVREFEELGDRAGEIMALDAAGYCAEVQGDLSTAVRMHRRALDLARRVEAPEWETSQLTRLGSVLALAGSNEALKTLQSAVDLASGIRCNASLALARNGLGLAVGLAGDSHQSSEIHAGAMAWYEAQGSPAGVSYTSGRLARESSDPTEALNLADRSLTLAVQTRDPRAIAHGLETLALATDDPKRAARALGGARSLRREAHAPVPAIMRASFVNKEHELIGRLGNGLVHELRSGAKMARHLNRRSDHEDDVGEAAVAKR